MVEGITGCGGTKGHNISPSSSADFPNKEQLHLGLSIKSEISILDHHLPATRP
jgi:hypothetical protein